MGDLDFSGVADKATGNDSWSTELAGPGSQTLATEAVPEPSGFNIGNRRNERDRCGYAASARR